MLSKKGTDILVYIGCKFSKSNTKSGPKVEMSYLKVLRDPICMDAENCTWRGTATTICAIVYQGSLNSLKRKVDGCWAL